MFPARTQIVRAVELLFRGVMCLQPKSETLGLSRVPNGRSERALANDVAIRKATTSLILANGIDALSFRDIGREAGLTHGAMYARFENVEELLLDLWSSQLADDISAMWAVAVAAVSNPHTDSIKLLIDKINTVSTSDHAAVQVLVAARRFPILRAEIESFVQMTLENHFEIDDALHSRALVIFSVVVSSIILGALLGPDDECLKYFQMLLETALTVDPLDVEPIGEQDSRDRLLAEPKPDLASQLAYHACIAIGTHGYMDATVSRIARQADCSTGAIYKVYASKEDLVVSAIRMLLKAPWITLNSFCALLDEGQLTHLLDAAASVHNDVRKYFTIEVAIASTHNANVRAATLKQLKTLDLLAPLVSGLDERESSHLACLIRLVMRINLGTAILSTLVSDMNKVDINQFAEPMRRSILQSFPSWDLIQRQLLALVVTNPAPQSPDDSKR
jgi:AcrR family transcriptional regulator